MAVAKKEAETSPSSSIGISCPCLLLALRALIKCCLGNSPDVTAIPGCVAAVAVVAVVESSRTDADMSPTTAGQWTILLTTWDRLRAGLYKKAPTVLNASEVSRFTGCKPAWARACIFSRRKLHCGGLQAEFS